MTQQAGDISNPGPVLVLGASGQQGGAAARALLANSRPVRALMRNTGSAAAQALAARGAELVQGDLADDASIRAAMSGVDGVFSMQPNSGSPGSGLTDADEIRFGKRVADLAQEAGVSRLVYSSASIISQGPTGVANLDCKIEIEDYIRGLTIPWTIIRPATFMELLALPDFWPEPDVLTFFAGPDQPIEYIASDDIGRIAAAIFDAGDRFTGQSINIAGDELTGHDVEAAIGSALGRRVSYRRFPDEVLEQVPQLQQTVQLFESGKGTHNADLAQLARDFGPSADLKTWLKAQGRQIPGS